MPTLLECARAHATEGEMVDALQHVWGSYTESPVFCKKPQQHAASFLRHRRSG